MHNYIVNIHTAHTFVHINHTGRLLRKTENQYSDFYIQLAAHFLLEVYQETGTVTVMLINLFNATYVCIYRQH